ncbi:MAG: metal ABC transporter ATP-binding protein [Pseudomonadota bacterium]|nr:metal ABC transporter ATP-binding protein [Pseudomonadota bacterium]
MQLLELKDVSFSYDDKPPLNRISLNIDIGQFVCLIGPNGSGKTTLLKGLMGFLPQRSGSRVVCDRRNPRPEELRGLVGYIPQRLNLDPAVPVKVEEFLALKQNVTMSEQEVNLLSVKFDLEKIKQRSMHSLSAGEQQRVFLLFSILSEPKLLLLDESLEGTDIKVQHSIFKELMTRVKNHKMSVVLVSHDISAVSEWATRAVCLGPNIVFDGDPTSADFHTCLHKTYGESSFIHDHAH